MNDDLLRVYLDDHLAGSAAGLRLAKSCLEHQADGPHAAFLQQLVQEIEEDERTLKDLRGRIGGGESPFKRAAARIAQLASRMKLGERMLEQESLGELEELETLMLGVRGKLALWEALDVVCAKDPRFRGTDFERLKERARRQQDGLERARIDAAREAFSVSAVRA